MALTASQIQERLAAALGDGVGPLGAPRLGSFVPVRAERLLEAARFLKNTPGIELDHCDDLTALDWPKRSVIEVVYHLFSYRHRHGLVLKVEVDRKQPVAPSVQGVWKSASWMERECYDLFGVAFGGHPDLRRILLPDDWEGWPLRKDYREAGGYHGVSNERENPLVELRRIDERHRSQRLASAPAAPAPAAGQGAAPLPPGGGIAGPAPTSPSPDAPPNVAPLPSLPRRGGSEGEG